MKQTIQITTQLSARLWRDQRGAVLSTEIVLVASVALLGLMVGLAAYRDSVVNELADIGRGVGALDQSYMYTTTVDGDDLATGVTETYGAPGNAVVVTVSVAGTDFDDTPDPGDDAVITRGSAVGVNEVTPPPNPAGTP